jgi:hypothetical protein
MHFSDGIVAFAKPSVREFRIPSHRPICPNPKQVTTSQISA